VYRDRHDRRVKEKYDKLIITPTRRWHPPAAALGVTRRSRQKLFSCASDAEYPFPISNGCGFDWWMVVQPASDCKSPIYLAKSWAVAGALDLVALF